MIRYFWYWLLFFAPTKSHRDFCLIGALAPHLAVIRDGMVADWQLSMYATLTTWDVHFPSSWYVQATGHNAKWIAIR